jgi:hypothetical protein
MSDNSATMSVSLDYRAMKPRPVYIEPWGEDYWLFPGDDFKITAFGQTSPPYFGLHEYDDTTQIYIEGDCQDFVVQHDEKRIECGYQRAKLAGIVDTAFIITGRGVVIASDKNWQVDLKVNSELRLIIPNLKTVNASILGLEHINTGNSTELENPWGLFLGELTIGASEIKRNSFVYLVAPFA